VLRGQEHHPRLLRAEPQSRKRAPTDPIGDDRVDSRFPQDVEPFHGHRPRGTRVELDTPECGWQPRDLALGRRGACSRQRAGDQAGAEKEQQGAKGGRGGGPHRGFISARRDESCATGRVKSAPTGFSCLLDSRFR
jgi:hypothetical protein